MPTFISNQAATTGANKWHTSNVKRIKTMIRDFSLVFLLLISDRRNLHRDSRRDTEQNVPCLHTHTYQKKHMSLCPSEGYQFLKIWPLAHGLLAVSAA